MELLPCKICGGKMKKGKHNPKGTFSQLTGAMLALGGFAFCLTIVGIIVGLPLMIVGGRMMGKNEKVIQCRKCGYFVPAK